MGAGAATPDADAADPTPSFASPDGPERHRDLPDQSAGQRSTSATTRRGSTPVADTDPATKLGASAAFTPGTYRMLYVSPDRGFQRFTLTVRAGGAADRAARRHRSQPRSAAAGATVIGSTAGSLNAESLIDGTEATNWGGVTDRERRRRAPVRRGRPGRRRAHGPPGAGQRLPEPGPGRPDGCRSRPTRTPARASPRCASSPSRPASATARRDGPTWKRFYTSRRRRLPRRPAAAGGARPDPAHLRRTRPPGGRGAAGRAGEPVHRLRRVRRRAGQRPDQRHRLQDRPPTAARSCTPPSCRSFTRSSRARSVARHRPPRSEPRDHGSDRCGYRTTR